MVVCVSLFLHFSVLHRHHCSESFYELHFVLNCQLHAKNRAWNDNFCEHACVWLCVWVDGHGCEGYVLYVSLLVPDVIDVLPGTNVLLHWNLLMKALSQTQASHLDVDLLH